MADKNFIDQHISNLESKIDGAVAICIVDVASGMSLGTYSNGEIDPETASAFNVEVVKSKLKAIEALGINEGIEDILISLESQYHIISITKNAAHMIYVAAKKNNTNLALVRSVISTEKKLLESEL